jgi:hypothetical protein
MNTNRYAHTTDTCGHGHFVDECPCLNGTCGHAADDGEHIASANCNATYYDSPLFYCTLPAGHGGTEHVDETTDAPSSIHWARATVTLAKESDRVRTDELGPTGENVTEIVIVLSDIADNHDVAWFAVSDLRRNDLDALQRWFTDTIHHDAKENTMDIATAASTLVAETVLNGGATVDIESGTTISRPGYVVALGSEFTWKMHFNGDAAASMRMLDSAGVLPWVTQYVDQAATWIESFGDFAPVYVGAWIDDNTNTLYLDLVEIVTDREAAIKLATRRGELAIFDNTNGVDIPVSVPVVQ